MKHRTAPEFLGNLKKGSLHTAGQYGDYHE